MVILAGLLLGLVGSGHCAAMCGPLVLAAGPRIDRMQVASSGLRLLVYHGGRIATYLVLAVPAGLTGELLSLGGLERIGAVAAALVLVASAFGTTTFVPVRIRRFWSAAAARSCSLALPFSHHHPWAGAFAVGMANGLLPCGLVYAAVAASAGAGSMTAALAMMLGFGLGTVPALIVVSAAAASLAVSIRRRLARLAPLVLVIAAVLILVRALGWPKAERQHVHPAAHHIGVVRR
jgi:sulfite exporter TauE/SafE